MAYFRHPKTHAERRAHADPEHQPLARPARRRLPTDWDDHPPAARKNRNWKRFRPTKFRPPQ